MTYIFRLIKLRTFQFVCVFAPKVVGNPDQWREIVSTRGIGSTGWVNTSPSMKSTSPLSAALLLVASTALVPAADVSWTGATNATWSTPGNWNPATNAPLAADTAVFDAGSTANLSVTLGAATTVAGLRLDGVVGPVTVSGAQNFTAGALNIGTGTSLTVANGTSAFNASSLTGAGILTLQKSNTLNWTGGGTFTAANSLNFTGTLRLRGGTATTVPGTMVNSWLALGSAAASQAAGTTFDLDTGASTSDAKDFILTDAWTAKTLTLRSLSGFGTLRCDWGGTLGTEIRTVRVDQAADTTFNGLFLSHHGTGGRIRTLRLEKAGSGTLTMAGLVGRQTATTGGSADEVLLDVEGGRLVLTANNTRNGAVTVDSGAVLQIGNGGTTGTVGGGSIANNGELRLDHGTGANITIGNGITGTGTLVKNGAGTVAMTGSLAHSGSTTVNAGTLRLASGASNSVVSVNSGGTLAAGPVASAGLITLKALNLTAGSATTFRVGTTSDQIAVADADGLVVAGSHTISPVYTGGMNPGDSAAIFSYSGTLSGFANLSLVPGTRFQLVDNSFASTVDLQYTGGAITWKGNVTGDWDINTTANWVLDADNSATNFLQGDTVTFDDTATTGSVTLGAAASPLGISFENETLAYTLSGAGGSITGTGGISKSGAATAVVDLANTSTGGTTVTSGSLAFGVGGGTGEIGFGAVNVAAGASLILHRAHTAAGTDPDLDYKTTAKLRDVNGSGGIVLDGGAILFNYPGSGVGFAETPSWSTYSGNLVVKGGSEFRTIRNGATAMGTGTVTLGDATTSGALSQVEGSWTWTNAIAVTGPANQILNRSGAIAGGRILKLQGALSGAGGLTLDDPAAAMTNNLTGFIFTGDSAGFNGTLTIASGIPVRVGGIPGDVSVAGTGVNVGPSGSLGGADIVNHGSLTFSRNNAHTVTNDISGSGQLFVGLTGFGETGSQILSYGGTASHTGATTVRAGTLLVLGGAGLGGSSVTVQAGATLGGAGTITAPLSAAGTIAPGTSVGTLTVTGNTSSTGTLAIEVDGTTADKLAVTGDLDLSGTLTVNEITPFSGTDKVIAECTGSLTSTLTAPAGYTLVQSGSQLLLGKTAGSGYATWIGGFGLGMEVGLDLDPDGDGIPNGVEFALAGGQPAAPGGTTLPAVQDAGSNFTFSFQRDDRAKGTGTGVALAVEAGTDLDVWPEVYLIGVDTAASSGGVVVSNDGDSGPDTITVTIPKGGAEEKFARLRVTESP